MWYDKENTYRRFTVSMPKSAMEYRDEAQRALDAVEHFGGGTEGTLGLVAGLLKANALATMALEATVVTLAQDVANLRGGLAGIEDAIRQFAATVDYDRQLDRS